MTKIRMATDFTADIPTSSWKLAAVLFDLDGTLLPMDNDEFTKGYFKLLTAKMISHGYEAKQLVDAIWSGTGAMVKNDGSQSNEAAFWKKIVAIYGEKVLADKPLFDAFYANEFHAAKELCGMNPKAAIAVHTAKEMGLRVVLATNPIFPAVATQNRIRWAGLEPEDFELYTTYENIGYCKPNPDYYREIAKRLNVRPEQCLMVGNDVTEDMIAEEIGMKVFLLTDCLINRERKDINQYNRGGFDQLLQFMASMQPDNKNHYE